MPSAPPGLRGPAAGPPAPDRPVKEEGDGGGAHLEQPAAGQADAAARGEGRVQNLRLRRRLPPGDRPGLALLLPSSDHTVL